MGSALDLGRWVSADPLFLQGPGTALPSKQQPRNRVCQLNGYSYSLNAPVVFVDPTGEDAEYFIDTKTKTITITMRVNISGDRYSMRQAKADFDRTWGKGNTKGGYWEVACSTCKGVRGTGTWRVKIQMEEGKVLTDDNEIRIATGHRNGENAGGAYTKGDFTRILVKDTPGGGLFPVEVRYTSVSRTLEHEFGHLLGLPEDYYNEATATSISLPLGVTPPKDSIMGLSDAPVTPNQRNINMILDRLDWSDTDTTNKLKSSDQYTEKHPEQWPSGHPDRAKAWPSQP